MDYGKNQKSGPEKISFKNLGQNTGKVLILPDINDKTDSMNQNFDSS